MPSRLDSTADPLKLTRVEAVSAPPVPTMAAKRWTPPLILSCWWTRSCKRQVMPSESETGFEQGPTPPNGAYVDQLPP